ncbi:unnamed protein product [Amoebophrya sp. A25]|nr:unnamed protein product [Amoebophrya sp. A25]|eukprot:GSA25T00001082001.1
MKQKTSTSTPKAAGKATTGKKILKKKVVKKAAKPVVASKEQTEDEKATPAVVAEDVGEKPERKVLFEDDDDDSTEDGEDDALLGKKLSENQDEGDVDMSDDDIETAQRRLEAEAADEAAAAEAYQKDREAEQADESDGDDLHADDEDGEEEDKTKTPRAMDMAKLKEKLENSIKLLADWKTLGGNRSSRSRQEVREEIAELITMYYGYNAELATYFLDMFRPEEALAFFEANEKSRPVTLRCNTLKTRKQDLAKQLTSRGVNVANIGEWCAKEGLKVLDATVPVGATPEYLGGQYMIQAASSFVPVLALNPQQGESILDMAAAPGGKCTHIGQMMQNTGTLYVNEFQKQRLSSLMGNIHRLGLTNTVVMNYDGRDLKDVLPVHSLNRVLLDAPCSGAGIVARDPSIKSKRNIQEFEQTAQLQKQLLLTAIDLCDAKKDGIVVYSTCSVSVEENEMVVDHVLRKRNVKLVDFRSEVAFGVPGFTSYRGKEFHKSVELTQRFYPHRHNMDGFYVAKFQKLSNEMPQLQARERGTRGSNTVHWGKEKWSAMGEGLIEYAEDETEKAQSSSAKKSSVKNTETTGTASSTFSSPSALENKKTASSSATAAVSADAKAKLLEEKMMLFRSGNTSKLKKLVKKEKEVAARKAAKKVRKPEETHVPAWKAAAAAKSKTKTKAKKKKTSVVDK